MSTSDQLNTHNLRVEYRAVDSLVPYPRNARTHADSQISAIAASIREFGWTSPCLIRPDGTLIAGHGRLAAARLLGMKDVPAIVIDDLSDEQCRALVIADNKLTLNGGWDAALLTSEIREMTGLAEIDLTLLGFSDWELKAILDGESIEPQPEEPQQDSADDPMARIRVIVDRDDEADAREVIDRALTAAGLTFEVKP